jgi:hypothetical protein
MKFTRGVEPLPTVETSLVVERVRSRDAKVFGRVVAEGFGLDPFTGTWTAGLVNRKGWSCFLAWDGEEVAGAGVLYVSGRTGWLGLGCVVPAHRGKGAQRALFASRVGDAARRGCRLLVTETGQRVDGKPAFSYDNILHAGFEEGYLRPNWVRRAA